MKIIIHDTDCLVNFQAFKNSIFELDKLSIIQNSLESVRIGKVSVFFEFHNVPIFFESLNQISDLMKFHDLHLIDKNTIIYKLIEADQK